MTKKALTPRLLLLASSLHGEGTKALVGGTLILHRCLQKELHRRMRDMGDTRLEIEEALTEPSGISRHGSVASLPSMGDVRTRFVHRDWEPAAYSIRAGAGISRLTVTLPPGRSLSDRNDPAVALSPDGRRIVYVAGMLYVRPIDQLEDRSLPGTEGAATAFFSPDGEWVGFYDAAKLKKTRLNGGPPVELCDVPDPWGASWGIDNKILVARCAVGVVTGLGYGRLSLGCEHPRPKPRRDLASLAPVFSRRPVSSIHDYNRRGRSTCRPPLA